jgi:hypothetical protein
LDMTFNLLRAEVEALNFQFTLQCSLKGEKNCRLIEMFLALREALSLVSFLGAL